MSGRLQCDGQDDMSSDVHEVSAPIPHSRESEQAGRTVAGEPVRRLVLIALGLLVFAATVVMIAVVRGQQLSPVDEPAHADYAYQVAHGVIPSKGSLIDPEIRYEWSCRGIGDAAQPDCDVVGGTFEADSQDYTFGDPPLYYAVTGLLARGLDALIPGGHQFIALGRCIGALWLFGAMMVLYFALRKFRVTWPVAVSAALLLPLCPGVLAATSTITNDAAAAVSGAAALFVLARITVERRLGWVVPFVVTAAASATKLLDGMPMLAVACATGFLAISAWRRGDRPSAYRSAAVSAAVVVAFAGVYFGWSVYQAGRGVAGWVNPNAGNGVPLTGSPVGDMLSNLFSTFQNLTTNYWLAPQINGETVTIWATLLGAVLAAAPLLVMVISRTRSWGWGLGLAAFVSLSMVSLVVEYQVYADNNAYFVVVSARYAMSFLPWVIACLAVVVSRRRLVKTGFGFVGLGTAVMILAETGLFTLGPALVSHSSFLVG
jgi:hypothetical protein